MNIELGGSTFYHVYATQPTKIERCPQPGIVNQFADMNLDKVSNQGTPAYTRHEGESYINFSTYFRRHGNSANVSYLDGHVGNVNIADWKSFYDGIQARFLFR